MNLTGLFKRDRNLNSAFAALEAEVDEVLLNDLYKEVEADVQAEAAPVPTEEQPEAADPDGLDYLFEADQTPPLQPEAEAADHVEPAEPTITAYAQERFSSLASVEQMYQQASEDLKTLGNAFANVNAVHHLTREFLAAMQSTIGRVNDLELGNARLMAENSRVRRQAELVGRLKSQHEALIESTRRRESRMQQEIERFREILAEARQETVESRNALGAIESERANLMHALAGRTADAERLARENEVLRQRHVNQSADLDQAAKRASELQRKLDDLTVTHQAEANHLSEARSKLAVTEGELARMQKQNDSLQIDLADATASVKSLEREMDESAARHSAEARMLANENETLKAKAAALSASQAEAAGEVSMLRQRLKDAETEMRIAEDRVRQLKQEVDHARRNGRASDADNMREDESETAALREEIGQLTATVKRLKRFERLYRSVKDKKGCATPANKH